MNTKQILLFCASSLLVTLVALTFLFQNAALTPAAVTRATTAQPMENFKPVDLGAPYGSVSMTDLVGNYLEHPPQAPAGPAGEPAHIGGC
jgi:hypothetical protein